MSLSVDPATPLTDLSTLRSRLTGTLALPGDELYARLATPWNVAIATSPVAVVEARTAADVAAAVQFAGAAGLAVAVQATGHGVADGMDGAVLIHTGLLDECTIDPAGWARVGAGVQWEAVLNAAQEQGFGALCGSSPDVGVVGYTTGGGLGPVARTYGLASDLVRAIEVVTGDGVLRRVTADDEPDLFWALRGGKGALGIVTALEFDLIPQPRFYGGALYFAAADLASVLHAWLPWAESLPEAATTSAAIQQLPPMPGVPEPLAGTMTLSVRYVWTGDAAEGEALLAPLRAVTPAILDSVGEHPFAAMGLVHAEPVDPMPVHFDGLLLSSLTSAGVDALLAAAGPDSGSPQLIVELRQLDGAVGRPASAPDCVPLRGVAAYNLAVIGVPMPPDPSSIAVHATSVLDAVSEWSAGRTLPNFAAGAGDARMRRSYDEATLARLTELARRYDPQYVLRSGQVPVR